MANYTDVLAGEISPEQLTQLTTLLNNSAALNALVTESTVLDAVPTTVTVGAIPVTTATTFLSIDGTKAFTLANGTYEGQRKTLRCTVAANTPAGTVTPATASGFTSLLFDAVEDTAVLEWHAGGWRISLSVSVTVT